jgi:hypothetical protein
MDYRLRNYIPISGPATREPLVGDEPDLRLSIGFCPRWFHNRLGIDFSRCWHTDPDYRYATLVRMKTCLHETFPDLPNFRLSQVNGVEQHCATISGVYGIKLIPMLYGLDIAWRTDDWPDNQAHQFLSKEALSQLQPFAVAELPPLIELLAQMDQIEQGYGPINGYMNYQGLLNVAMKLRGNDLFLDIYDDPPFVRHLLGHIADTIRQTAQLVQERQRRSGFAVNLLSMSNCVMNLVSPETYEAFVLPHDLALSGQFDCFGIHTCNWDVTPYLDVLRRISRMGYLDMGPMSDMIRARHLFPDARRAVFYAPVALMQNSPERIRADIEKIYRDLAPCDIVLADISEATDDERIRQFYSIMQSVDQTQAQR